MQTTIPAFPKHLFRQRTPDPTESRSHSIPCQSGRHDRRHPARTFHLNGLCDHCQGGV